MNNKKSEEPGLKIGLNYIKVLTGKKSINEAEVLLLTKVAREAKQHENFQKNIVISGLPKRSSTEVKERIEPDRVVVNKLIEMLDVDRFKIKNVKDSGILATSNPGVVIVFFSF